MQLATMIHHGSGRAEHREAHQLHHQNHSYLYSARAQTRAHQPHPEVAAALASNPYSHHTPLDYSAYPRAPQSPPSPPVEEVNKPSLPSISSLLGIADASGQIVPPQTQGSMSMQPRPSVSPAQQVETRLEAAPQNFGAPVVSNTRMTLPPTPPMQPDSMADGNRSPSSMSQASVTAQPYFLGQSLNNMDPDRQRQPVNNGHMKRTSVPSQPSSSPYHTSPYTHSPYGSSPAPTSGSYYSPENQVYTSAALYAQRPLPSNFPPSTVPVPMPNGNNANPWQHHHYISASSQAAFPQSQDRYICQTCNKAFSRPSSLRIHSHSHTGEKPYKCPQPGCGKAFSVRSNMKRHERGCHASATLSLQGS